MGWGALDGSNLNCYEARYVTTRIEAFYGKPFVVRNDFDKHWRDTIIAHAKKQKYPYKLDPNYSAKKIPSIAKRNLQHFRKLVARRKPCAKDPGRVNQVLLGKILTQLKQMARGERKLPKVITKDGDPPTTPEWHMRWAKDFQRTAENIDTFYPARWTSPTIKSPKASLRAIEFDFEDRTSPPIGSTLPVCENNDEDQSQYSEEDEEGGMCAGWLHIDKRDRIVGYDSWCVACPFVYQVDANNHKRYIGEILRNQKSEQLDTWNTLALKPVSTQFLHIHIAEKKPETTYLDAVELIIGNRRVLPQACQADIPIQSTTQRPKYCDANGRYHTLSSGDSIDLYFDIPTGLEHVMPTLRAKGYYLHNAIREPSPT